MKRWILKILIGAVALVAFVIAGVGAYVQLRADRIYDAPAPALRASMDADVVARGRYLAYGPAHCAYCHTTPDRWPALDAGEEPPLTGGYELPLPIGTLYTPNLTPDPETGIGRFTDGQLARMLRHNVRPDGRAAFPFMGFQQLSDDDVVALISFLRSQPPVRNAVPDRKLDLLGKAVLTFVIRPKGPATMPPAASPPEAPTIERGAYLADVVGECVFCHTSRNLMNGAPTGPLYAGGLEMERDGDPNSIFVSPNLTPDPKTGRIAGWTEEQFLARFRAGRMIEGTHMPWEAYGRMSDDDIRAIYRYLMSRDPVENETGPLLQARDGARTEPSAADRD